MNQENILNVKMAVAAVVGTMTALWGWFGWLVLVWMLLMVADWLVGVWVACKDGVWSSGKAKDGVAHKVGQVIIFAIALVLDWLIGTVFNDIGLGLPISYSVLVSALVLVWYIVGELGSLAEHAVAMGAPVPSWLMKILEVSENAVNVAGGNITEGTKNE